MHKCFKTIACFDNGNYLYYQKSKGLSDERINVIKIPNHSITLNLNYFGAKKSVEFNGSCLKQDGVTFNHGKVVNIYLHCIRDE